MDNSAGEITKAELRKLQDDAIFSSSSNFKVLLDLIPERVADPV